MIGAESNLAYWIFIEVFFPSDASNKTCLFIYVCEKCCKGRNGRNNNGQDRDSNPGPFKLYQLSYLVPVFRQFWPSLNHVSICIRKFTSIGSSNKISKWLISYKNIFIKTSIFNVSSKRDVCQNFLVLMNLA